MSTQTYSHVDYPETPEILSERDIRMDAGAAPTDEQLLLTYRWMAYSRFADMRILELFRQGRMKGTVTCSDGNEGLVAPMALMLDKEIDCVSWTHRGLPGHLIWSDHLGDHISQYLGNAGSPTLGREGNAHHGDPANRSYPMISHLGKMSSNVLGGTDSQRRKGLDAIGVTFFGDGGSSTGEIHESLNLAAVLNIPVIFVVENNKYAYSTPLHEQYAGELVDRAKGYGIKGIALDVAKVEENMTIFADAIRETRQSGRPMLIEMHSLRLRGHAGYDTCDYIDPAQTEKWIHEDALPNFRTRLVEKGYGDRLDQEDATLKAFVNETVSAAFKNPPCDPSGLIDDVFSPTTTPVDWSEAPDASETSSLTFAQAINAALDKVLADSPESLVMGQDIADYGGPFKVTEDLLEKYGRSRVLNTPICESAMVGYATGMAINGHRPIVEFQFADFATDATTQICLNAGTYHFRSGAKVPLIFRFPCGGGLTFGSFHSQDLEALYTHIPGLKFLYPSTPQDAYNAVLAAYEDDNPVCLFEHKKLYRLLKAPVSFDPNYKSVWQPALRRSGDYATVVTYGEMTLHANEACEYLEKEYDVSCDLFDLRCLSPLKLDTIETSLARTGRLVVITESRRNVGFAAELVARLTEKHFFNMEAPPLRIASKDMPVPFAPELEADYRPSKESILNQLIDWIEGV
ncbi:thiamine pyrophosphate-dependent enzyme [Pelagicoccus sp. SDUM812003]|uniref:alpha-ketoacid dehydrogenase subunit alpha/beta n=1 Tax=Pelagicoccus sp. SDUM812003 TaxID=3041267 RepID=UPI00280F05F9|nr:thiamine pyrophosphate-dependent enzyme [Pelagicoccus sp. SDUM812003]MDQ8203868.1 thiamine pyrophosphate-dependent enzyme [Pelagicoccus sp. SDUM812003]